MPVHGKPAVTPDRTTLRSQRLHSCSSCLGRWAIQGYSLPVSQKSEPTNLGAPRVCSIADALQIVGERWSLLVLRELNLGVRRFGDILVNTGAPRETLSTRLRALEEAGLIERRRYSDHPPRDEYFLTDAGKDIDPILAALQNWGQLHASR